MAPCTPLLWDSVPWRFDVLGLPQILTPLVASQTSFKVLWPPLQHILYSLTLEMFCLSWTDCEEPFRVGQTSHCIVLARTGCADAW
jgi:hypothetical protein